MQIPAYTSVTSEKVAANTARNFLLEVGPEKYAEAVRTLAHSTLERLRDIEARREQPFGAVAGKTADEIEQWLDVKNPSPKVEMGNSENLEAYNLLRRRKA